MFQVILLATVITFIRKIDTDTEEYETNYGKPKDLYEFYISPGKYFTLIIIIYYRYISHTD